MQRKVSKSGLVLRLIDVVFLLLFGFISIAQVNARRVTLPQTADSAAPQEPQEPFSLYLGADGVVRVMKEGGVGYPLPGRETRNEERAGAVAELAQWLDPQLREYRESHGMLDSLPMQIHPDRGAMVQWTIDVWDACRILGVEAAIAGPMDAEF